MVIKIREELKMVGFESYKDVVAVVGVQSIIAGFALFSKAAFRDGLSPQIYVLYRQVIATLVTAPFAIFFRKKSGLSLCPDLKTLGFIFLAALFGLTASQSAYYEAIDLSSATIASALLNLTTAVTFVLATILGLERVDVWSLRGGAKIVGTVVCIAGAVAVSLLKGSTLLAAIDSSWLLGCFLAFSSCWFWSTWLVLQVSINKNCPDMLYTTFLTCLFASADLMVFAMFMERQVQDWKLNTTTEYVACIFSGVGTSVTIFGQAWCISRRGPVFFATFNPLNSVIVAIIGSIFLNESIYLGSLLGSLAIIVGLYMVLWGKANDQVIDIIIDDHLQEPLLSHNHDIINLEEEEQDLQYRSP